MEDDQEICRVCRSESTISQPLYHPCKCAGSIRFVHESCLIEWLSHSRKKYCELCEHPFKFTPIYRDDMPESVPILVFFSQLIRRLASFLKNLFRGLTVIFVWLIILPNFTLWTWRFYFWSGEHIGFNTLNTTKEEEIGGQSPLKNFLSDCLEGQIITAFVIIIFVAAYLFREWVMQNLPAVEEQAEVLERNEEQLVQEQVAVDTLLNAMHTINPPELRDHEHHRLEHQLDEIRNEIDQELDHQRQETAERNEHHRSEHQLDEIDQELRQESAEHNGQEDLENLLGHHQQIHGNDDTQYFRQFVANNLERGDRGLVENEEIRRFFDNNMDRPLNPPVRLEEEENEEVFEVADDMNGVLEAIGMRGNPWMLVQNSVLMSLMISLCLGLAVWIPYVVGRLVIMIRPISFIETPIYILRFVTDPLVDFVLDTCLPLTWSLADTYWKQWVPPSIQTALSFYTQETAVVVLTKEQPTPWIDWSLIESKIEETSRMALERWHQFALGHTALDRSMCILVGYFVFICLGSWYLANSKRRTSTVQDIIRQQGIFLKVLFFIVIELVVFPTVCGFLLDFATLPLFVNASISTRYAFHFKSPYSSYFLHWFLGTGVLFYFAIFITVSREIIRPGVMWFVRDPNDPQFHPVQEMVERPFPNLLYKISQSAIMYSTMLVFGVGTVTYTLALTRVVFPLRLPFNKPLSTLALDLLIIQFLLPPLVHLVNPRENAKRALALWWHWACRLLRLTSFMFNERKLDEEGRHVRRSWKAMLLRTKAEIPNDALSDLAIDEGQEVVFDRNGQWVRVPRYDSVPVDPKRRMLVPVDPVTLEAIDPEERERGHPAAADTGDEAQSTIVVYVPPHFKLRTIVFLLFMWLFISLFVCSVTVVPLLFGRFLFKAYLAPQVDMVNDLYSFTLGLYLLVGACLTCTWTYRCYVTYKLNGYSFSEQWVTYVTKASRYVYLIFSLGVVIPLLLGISVDLFVFMPIRTYHSKEGIVIHLSQNWAFGIVYISLFYHTVQLLPTQNRVKVYMDSVFGNNMIQADLKVITRKVIVPVIMVALGSIFLPGVLSWSLFQLMDTKDSSLQLLVIRYTYPALFGSMITILFSFVFRKLFKMWLKAVKDDTYKIREALHNFDG